MPGPYAHLTLLQEMMQPDRLESIFSPSSRLPAILQKYLNFCMLSGGESIANTASSDFGDWNLDTGRYEMNRLVFW